VPEAYEAYLRGRQLWGLRGSSQLVQALELFRRAAEIDPDYAHAFAGIADCYVILGDIGMISQREATHGARKAMARALELDPELPEALTSQGFLCAFYDWDWKAARQAFEHAIAVGPGYATARHWYAEFLISQGEFEAAERESRLGVALDPLSAVIATSLGDVYFFSRRFDQAIAVLQEIRERDPSFTFTMTDMARAMLHVGRAEEAIGLYEQAQILAGGSRHPSAGLTLALATAGRVDEARKRLATLETLADDDQASRHAVASVHLALGNVPVALDWLERAYDAHERALAWAKVHPRLDPIRDEPRFQRLLERLGLT
jgi:tetratricopeptide (TPR) repeat protein